ncbi:hypothetical protein L1286_20115 [Pseudoalteromonas sp. SMS1]|uniref:hypothetical protein n=1 Tax=Pseudoalteromonas sp. SMS1 TaxID=2908894 RepID=UPI001F20E791|nr:hypothetical protein [Pseudoalteromonas sp. SMS1]MCF2859791.1 hypothetical protein [Pseudoalteromonas sp. SMS1]
MEEIAEWLLKHKIFFETAAAVFLSMMAILVSTAQLLVARKQTRLASAQYKVALQQSSPNIHLMAKMTRNPDTNKVEDDNIEIVNLGAPAFEANCKLAIFLNIKAYKNIKNPKVITSYIALSNYYSGVSVSQNAQNLMFVVIGRNNHGQFCDLERAFSEQLRKRDLRYSSFEIERYVKISYSDTFGNQFEHYYQVELVSGARRIDKGRGEEKFKLHKKSMPSSLSEISFDDIL